MTLVADKIIVKRDSIRMGEYEFKNLLKKDLQPFRLFLIGQKPSMFIEGKDEKGIFISEAVKRDFHIQYLVGAHGDLHMLISNNKEKFDRFVSKGLIPVEGEEYPFFDHTEMGLVLGYPPVAVRAFESYNRSNWRHMHFHGMNFGVQEQDVEDAVRWLKDTYTIPKEYQTMAYYSKSIDNGLDFEQIYF